MSKNSVFVCCSYLDGTQQSATIGSGPFYDINDTLSAITQNFVYVSEIFKGSAIDMLHSSDVFLFISSYSSNASESCLALVHEAITMKKPIAVIRLDDSPINNDLAGIPKFYYYKDRFTALQELDLFLKKYIKIPIPQDVKKERRINLKKILGCVLFFILSGVLISFAYKWINNNMEEQVYKYTLNYIPVEDNENNRYGLFSSTAELLIASQFKESPTSVINSYFAIDEDEGLSLYRIQDGNYVKIEGAEGLEEIGVISNGLIPVCRNNEKIQILDNEGNYIFTLDTVNGIEVRNCYSYSCERMRVRLADNTYVYVDKQGNQLFKRTFSWGTDFDHDVAVVHLENKTYALIDKNGKNLFTFESNDSEKITFSPINKRLATVDINDRIVIYDFQGVQIGIYPSKVKSIYHLGKENFIFLDDYYLGLMTYEGQELIMAKYDQLVPNGKYYLAIHEDNGEEVKLIDEHGNTLKILDGEEVFDFHALGLDFPNVIIRSDDEIYIVDEYGEIVGKGAFNYEFDEDDVLYANYVSNLYFPQDKVLDEIMDLCGQGNGLPISQNAFFYKEGRHCYPSDVKFIRNSIDISKFKEEYSAFTTISIGINHLVKFGIGFDEPIVRGDTLSKSAWLTNMLISVTNDNIFSNAAFFNICKNKLLELGCTILHSNNNNHILYSNNHENLIVMVHDINNNSFYIRLYMNTESNRSYWINSLDSNS